MASMDNDERNGIREKASTSKTVPFHNTFFHSNTNRDGSSFVFHESNMISCKKGIGVGESYHHQRPTYLVRKETLFVERDLPFFS